MDVVRTFPFQPKTGAYQEPPVAIEGLMIDGMVDTTWWSEPANDTANHVSYLTDGTEDNYIGWNTEAVGNYTLENIAEDYIITKFIIITYGDIHTTGNLTVSLLNITYTIHYEEFTDWQWPVGAKHVYEINSTSTSAQFNSAGVVFNYSDWSSGFGCKIAGFTVSVSAYKVVYQDAPVYVPTAGGTRVLWDASLEWSENIRNLIQIVTEYWPILSLIVITIIGWDLQRRRSTDKALA